MTPGLPQPIAPGSEHQLAALAVAVAGAVLVVVLVNGAAWLWRRRPGPNPTPGGSLPAEPEPGSQSGPAVGRLLGGTLLFALLLPLTVAVRQLWPHPDLGWKLVVVWLVALLVPTLTWLAARAAGRYRRPGS